MCVRGGLRGASCFGVCVGDWGTCGNTVRRWSGSAGLRGRCWNILGMFGMASG